MQPDAMLPLTEAFRIADEATTRLQPGRELRSLEAAAGCCVAEDQMAELNLPPFRKSAMDGYAIPEGEASAAYRLTETIAAGQLPSAPLAAGTCVKVMTGAPVPEGTARVVPVEAAEAVDGAVRPQVAGGATNICEQGEDVAEGEVVLKTGTRLTPLARAHLLGCGIAEVEVYRPLRLAILSSGDEIVDHPDHLRPGCIVDTNTPLLTGLAERHGMEVCHTAHLSDDPQETEAGLRAALDAADLVILTGGVSMGDFDCIPDAMQALGLEIHFTRLAVKPGKPTTLATSADRMVFGLPGNPVSAFLMFHLFILRVQQVLTGNERGLHEHLLVLDEAYERSSTERCAYVPARIRRVGTVQPVVYHGSAHLAALLNADGFFHVPQGTRGLPSGSHVTFYRLPRGC